MKRLFELPDGCPECGGYITFVAENLEHNQGRWQCWGCDAAWSQDGVPRD